MTPALEIVLGLFFMAGGGFVVVQGLRARKINPAPWPKFFLVAFVIHAAILVLGVGLIAKGLYAMSGA
jgi:hypothetical protein